MAVNQRAAKRRVAQPAQPSAPPAPPAGRKSRKDETPLSERQVADRLWLFFEREGIDYCVLGANAADSGGDIDIVIGSLKDAELVRTMQRFCAETGVSLVQELQHEWSARCFVLVWPDGNGGLYSIRPDICGDYVQTGRTVLSAGELLAGCRVDVAAGHRVPAPAIEFIYYLTKKVAKGQIDDRHSAHLSAAWRESPEGARAGLARFWPEEDAALLARAAENEDWRDVREALPRLYSALRRRLFWAPGARRREVDRLWDRLMRPAGFTVALLGADGCGKSSVIDRMIPALSPAFRQTRRLHLRPRFGLPAATRGAPVDDPHALPRRNAVVSVGKLLYFALDYAAGTLFRLWPLRARWTLIVYDRYFHDVLVDPLRYRYGGSLWLAERIARLVPQPDLWILLDAPPDVLQARKQEVSADETARQRRAYLALAASHDTARVIDSSRPLETVSADAVRMVVETLAARLAKRTG